MAKTLEVIDGVECSVETGTGTVKTLGAGKRNVEVVFDADHTKLQHPPKGWLDTKDRANVHQVAEQALAYNERIAYRIVIRRKDGEPTDVPLSAIGQYKRIRDVTDIVIIGKEGSFPAEWDRARSSGPDVAGAAPAGTTDGNASHEPPQPPPPGEPGDGTPVPNDPDEPAAGPPGAPPVAPGSDGKRGPRMAEPKPWEPYQVLAGGQTTINLGSYAVQAVEGMVLLAHELLLAKAAVEAKTSGRAFAPPSEGQLRALARRLTEAADRVQANIRPDGRADRMDGSHTRARAAIRSALEVHPVPWGAEPDQLAGWLDQVVVYATSVMQVVLAIVVAGEAVT